MSFDLLAMAKALGAAPTPSTITQLIFPNGQVLVLETLQATDQATAAETILVAASQPSVKTS